MFASWFKEPGAHVLVDGQFGSTGKGLLAGLIAELHAGNINVVTTNAGPNSGHTAYLDGQKVMTQQVPVASVFLEKLGHRALTYLNGGAIIDPVQLAYEVNTWLDHHNVVIHPCAAMIGEAERKGDQINVASVAGTGKGIGPALIRKLTRVPEAVARGEYMPMLPVGMGEDFSFDRFWDWSKDRVFVETAQGFSLGLNSARFYPYTTTRECTVMQAIADARIPAQMVKKVVASFRTYPIRVGNTDTGYSGDGYHDQREIRWEDIDQSPELTTVTKRVRRLFTWSRVQFRECVAANRPDAIFLNFCNYMSTESLLELIQDIQWDYDAVMGRAPEDFILGFGPNSSDCMPLTHWLANNG